MPENGSFLDVAEYGAGLDWLTFTSPLDRDGLIEFAKFGRTLMESHEGVFGQRAPKAIGAYKGHVTGDISFVQRGYDKHMMLVATGEASNKLAEEVITHGVRGNVSRIDAQCTSRATIPNSDYIEQCREYATATRGEKGSGRRKAISLFDAASGSTGLAVNSRSSAKYGRSYDWEAKHARHKGYKLWRHELEMKEEAATNFWAYYQAKPDRRGVVIATVKTFFEDARIMLPWLGDIELLQVIATKKQSDADSRLEYFEKVVIPMMWKMVNEGNLDAMKEIAAKNALVFTVLP